LCHFVNGIFGRLPDLVISLCKEKTYHLIAFAGGNHGKIFNFFEYPFSGGVDFQFHSAMRAGATAKRVCQCSVSLPLVSALGAGNNTFGRPAPDVFKAMTESILCLYLGDFG
jgi:putative membrane protein